MKGIAPRILSLAALTVLGAATETSAAVVVPGTPPNYTFPDGTSGFALATFGGVLNPGILVGFNPQPDPPGAPLPSLDLAVRDHPVVTESYGTTFSFVLSVGGGPGLLLPAVQKPSYDADIGKFITNYGFEYGGKSFEVDLEFSGPGSSITWSAFNPQPDPPGDIASYAIGFTGDASVGIQIQENGKNLSFSAMPERSTWAMMGLGFAAVGVISLRSRRNARPA